MSAGESRYISESGNDRHRTRVFGFDVVTQPALGFPLLRGRRAEAGMERVEAGKASERHTDFVDAFKEAWNQSEP